MFLYKKIIVLLTIVLIYLTMFSCKKEANNTPKRQKINSKLIEYTIEFPDTVYLNETYKGVVNYKSKLDTITTSFDDKENNRYVILYLTIAKEPDSDYKHLKKVAKMIGAHNYRKIFISDIKFTQTGTHFIDGIIVDNVLIDTIKNKTDDDLLRYIENEERIIHKVIVIKKPIPKSKTI